MSRGERLAAALLLGGSVVVAGTAGAAAYAWHSAGRFHLAVQSGGPDGGSFSMTLPAAVLDAAIALCPLPRNVRACPSSVRVADLAPALRGFVDELERGPDAVLVDARDGSQTVRVLKSGSALQIRIASPGERIAVDVPIRTLRRVLERIERDAGPYRTVPANGGQALNRSVQEMLRFGFDRFSIS